MLWQFWQRAFPGPVNKSLHYIMEGCWFSYFLFLLLLIPAINERKGIPVLGMMITVYDLAAWHSAQQRMWKDILPALDGVVFIIDASDRDRFEEAKKHFEVYISTLYIGLDICLFNFTANDFLLTASHTNLNFCVCRF